jgi:hypothetical protein
VQFSKLPILGNILLDISHLWDYNKYKKIKRSEPMNEILKDLFYGGIQPALNEYDCEFKDKIEYIEKDLNETFNDKQKELMKSYIIAHRNYKREIAYKNFKYGFKLSHKIIFAALK